MRRAASSSIAASVSAVMGSRETGREITLPSWNHGRAISRPGTFKCRSTPTGTLPLDTDLFTTIGRGIYASGMPSWGCLDGRGSGPTCWPMSRISAPATAPTSRPRRSRFPRSRPAPRRASPAAERSLSGWSAGSATARTAAATGRRPPPSPTAKIVPSFPTISPRALRFKCGQTNEDLYRIFMTGLDGTPMPSFHDNLQSDEAWDLVHYLRTLQEKVKK